VEKIRALLKAHDDAMTNHDLDGVMKCLTKKAAIMGTGPGEVWVGPEEIKVAYEHFFGVSIRATRTSNISLRLMMWVPIWALMTSGRNGKEGWKGFRVSLEPFDDRGKESDGWRIASMHFPP
jgi:hypothetical protein